VRVATSLSSLKITADQLSVSVKLTTFSKIH
jgi:hypothetical protein